MARLWLALSVVGLALTVWVSGAAAMTFRAATGSPFALSGGAMGVAVGDFDSDGNADVVAGSGPGHSVLVLLGDGSGGFATAPGSPFSVGSDARAVAAGDFNLDGKQDLAVADIAGSVNVLLGDGSGRFSAASGSPVPVTGCWPYCVPVALTAGDVNGDHKPDLAIANGIGNSVSVLLGDGAGGFSAAGGSPFAAGSYALSLTVADFDRDGNPDLAVANSDSNDVSVLLGDGAGGFSPAAGSPLATGSSPLAVAAADLDGDGNPDLVVGNGGADSVTVLLGDGAGGFGAAAGSPFATGRMPRSVTVADFDGDGAPDVAVADEAGATVTLLLGDGSGALEPAVGSPFAVGDGPYAVAARDFDSDGKPDLAVAVTAGVAVLIDAPPDTSITAGPADTTRKRVASFTFESTDASATFECRLDSESWSACTSPASYTNLSGGAHTFRVRALNEVGLTDPTGATQSWTIDLASSPLADLSASPSRVLTGGTVTLDAAGSHDVLDGTIVDYEWDLNGTGSFDRDTGSTATTTVTYATASVVHPRVRVTNDVGTTATATATVDVRAAPPAGPVGISVNGGDFATNDPAVTLTMIWPDFASSVLVSNDGGFRTRASTLDLAPTAQWTLDETGPERLPKTVYVRFIGAGQDTTTFTDDIILDQTPPTVQSAQLTTTRSTSSVSPTADLRRRVYGVKIKARDKIVGVCAVAVSRRRSGGTAVPVRNCHRKGVVRLRKTVRIRAARPPKYVRVLNSAGTWSRWVKVRR